MYATCAFTGSPVNNIFKPNLFEVFLAKAIPGVEQKIPNLIPGVEN
jgi:hypothetical protein